MNDHDLLITINANLNNLTSEVIQLRDGTRKDIQELQTKVDVLEKTNIEIRNDIKQTNNWSIERYTLNGARLSSLEAVNKEGVQRHESNRAYIWRKVFESCLPFVYLAIGGAIIWYVKTGIIK